MNTFVWFSRKSEVQIIFICEESYNGFIFLWEHCIHTIYYKIEKIMKYLYDSELFKLLYSYFIIVLKIYEIIREFF